MSVTKKTILDLFGWREPTQCSPSVLNEERRFGKWDAKCGFPLRNYYSDRIFGERLAAYESAFRDERRNVSQ